MTKDQKDLAFLEELQHCSPKRLREITDNYLHKSVPAWKAVALLRAWARFFDSRVAE